MAQQDAESGSAIKMEIDSKDARCEWLVSGFVSFGFFFLFDTDVWMREEGRYDFDATIFLSYIYICARVYIRIRT